MKKQTKSIISLLLSIVIILGSFGLSEQNIQAAGVIEVDLEFQDWLGTNNASYPHIMNTVGFDGCKIILYDSTNTQIGSKTMWPNNGVQQFFTGLADGNYTLKLTDENSVPLTQGVLDPDGKCTPITPTVVPFTVTNGTGSKSLVTFEVKETELGTASVSYELKTSAGGTAPVSNGDPTKNAVRYAMFDSPTATNPIPGSKIDGYDFPLNAPMSFTNKPMFVGKVPWSRPIYIKQVAYTYAIGSTAPASGIKIVNNEQIDLTIGNTANQHAMQHYQYYAHSPSQGAVDDGDAHTAHDNDAFLYTPAGDSENPPTYTTTVENYEIDNGWVGLTKTAAPARPGEPNPTGPFYFAIFDANNGQIVAPLKYRKGTNLDQSNPSVSSSNAPYLYDISANGIAPLNVNQSIRFVGLPYGSYIVKEVTSATDPTPYAGNQYIFTNPRPGGATVDRFKRGDDTGTASNQANRLNLQLTKNVTKSDGTTPHPVTETFHFALFSGATLVPGSVVPISFANQDTKSVTAWNGTAAGTYTIKETDAAGVPVNTALSTFPYTVTYNPSTITVDSNGIFNSDITVTNKLKTVPNVSVVKTADKTTALTGDTIRYTITATNNGDGTASTVNLSDVVPAGTTFNGPMVPGTNVSTASSPSYTGGTNGTFTWTMLNLSPGESRSVWFDVTIDALPVGVNSGSVTNVATATGSGVNPIIIIPPVVIPITRPAPASLSATKTVDATSVEVGDTVRYTLSVTNSGEIAANNVTFSDALPVGVTYIDAPASHSSNFVPTYTAGTRTLAWNLGTVPAGGTVTVWFDVTADALQVGALSATVANIAVVGGDGTPTNPNIPAPPVTVNPLGTPSLTATKTVDATSVEVGDTVRYTLSVTNSGTAPSNNVTFSDALPVGVTYIDAPASHSSNFVPTYTAGTRTLAWNLGTVPAGGTVTVWFDVTADALQVGALSATVANIAVVGGDGTPTNPNIPAPPVTVNPLGTPILSATKTVDATSVEVGDTVRYTLSVTNSGTAPSNNVTFSDALPVGVTYIDAPASHSANFVPTYTAGTRTLAWNLGTVAAGATETVWFDVTADALQVGALSATVANIAVVGGDGTPTNPNIPAPPVTVNPLGTPILSATKTVDATSVEVGDTVRYTLSVTNSGSSASNNVTFTDALPVGVTYIDAPASHSSNFVPTYTAGTRTLAWNLGTVAAGATETVWFDATADALQVGALSATVANIAVVGGDGTPTNPNIPAPPVTVNPLGTPILSATKTVDATSVEVGDTVRYTLSVTNSGSSASNNVTFTDALPVGVTYIDAPTSHSSNFVPTYTAGTRTLAWNLGTVPAGGTITVWFDVTADALQGGALSATVANIAVVGGDGTPTNPNITAPPVTVNPLGTPILSATKTVDATSVEVGDTVRYTLSVTNSGSSASNNVTFTDALPVGVTYIDAPASHSSNFVPTYTAGTRTLAWNLGTVPAGGTVTVWFDVTADALQGGALSATVANIAVVGGDGTPTNPNITAPPVTVNPLGTPILSATKTVDATSVEVGDTVRYTLSVTNSGSSASNNVTFTDALPVGVTYIDAPASHSSNFVPTYTAGTRTLAWNLGTVPAGGTVTVWFDVTADALQGGALSATVANIAVVGGDGTPTNPNITAPPVVVNPQVTPPSLNNGKINLWFEMETNSVWNAGDVFTYQLTKGGTVITNVSQYLNASLSAPSSDYSIDNTTGIITINSPNAKLVFDLPPDIYTVSQVSPVPNYINTVADPKTFIIFGNEVHDAKYVYRNDVAPLPNGAGNFNLTKTISAGSSWDAGDSFVFTIYQENSGTFTSMSALSTYVNTSGTTLDPTSYTINDADSKVTIHKPQTNVSFDFPTGVYMVEEMVAEGPMSGTKYEVIGSATQTKNIDTTQKQFVFENKQIQGGNNNAPYIEAHKFADEGRVKEGDNIRYILSVKNTGTGVATNVVLKDTIPAGTIFTSVVPGVNAGGDVIPTLNGNTLTWTFTNIQPNETKYVWFDVKTADLPEGENSVTVKNVAVISGDGVGPIDKELPEKPITTVTRPDIIGGNEDEDEDDDDEDTTQIVTPTTVVPDTLKPTTDVGKPNPSVDIDETKSTVDIDETKPNVAEEEITKEDFIYIDESKLPKGFGTTEEEDTFIKLPSYISVNLGDDIDFTLARFGNKILYPVNDYTITDKPSSSLTFIEGDIPAFTNGEGLTYDILYSTNKKQLSVLYSDVDAGSPFSFECPYLAYGEYITEITIKFETVPAGFGVGDEIVYTFDITKGELGDEITNKGYFSFNFNGKDYSYESFATASISDKTNPSTGIIGSPYVIAAFAASSILLVGLYLNRRKNAR